MKDDHKVIWAVLLVTFAFVVLLCIGWIYKFNFGNAEKECIEWRTTPRYFDWCQYDMSGFDGSYPYKSNWWHGTYGGSINETQVALDKFQCENDDGNYSYWETDPDRYCTKQILVWHIK